MIFDQTSLLYDLGNPFKFQWFIQKIIIIVSSFNNGTCVAQTKKSFHEIDQYSTLLSAIYIFNMFLHFLLIN